MKPDDRGFVHLKLEEKEQFEDGVTYVYAGTDSAAVHKPITVYKRKNSNEYLVAGRYAGFTDTGLMYKPLNSEEQKLVVERLGAGKIVKFLTNE